MSEQRKIKVAVVFGGRSTEHAVSCVSAGNVLAAIDTAKYEVIPIGITRAGQWVLAAGDPARLAISDGRLPSVESLQPLTALDPDAPAAGPGTAAEPGTPQERTAPLTGANGESSLVLTGPGQVPQALAEADVVLPLLHGAYGEDGTIQGMLELAGIRYAGAGVFASAAGMDKEYMKLIFKAHDLPVGPYVVVHDRDWGQAADDGTGMPVAVQRKRVLDEISDLGWPVFVKPARGGSSIGISKASDIAELHEAIEAAREHDKKVLVEAAIAGLEIECGVLEGTAGAPPDTSLPGPGPGGWCRGVLRLRGQVPRRRHQHGDPGPDPCGAHPRDTAACRDRVRRAFLRGARAGGLLLHAGWPDPRQRDQHHAGYHARLGLPAHVGGDRRAAQGTHRPDSADHPAQADRPALSRARLAVCAWPCVPGRVCLTVCAWPRAPDLLRLTASPCGRAALPGQAPPGHEAPPGQSIEPPAASSSSRFSPVPSSRRSPWP